MWDLIVSIPDRCLSFYCENLSIFLVLLSVLDNCQTAVSPLNYLIFTWLPSQSSNQLSILCLLNIHLGIITIMPDEKIGLGI